MLFIIIIAIASAFIVAVILTGILRSASKKSDRTLKSVDEVVRVQENEYKIDNLDERLKALEDSAEKEEIADSEDLKNTLTIPEDEEE